MTRRLAGFAAVVLAVAAVVFLIDCSGESDETMSSETQPPAEVSQIPQGAAAFVEGVELEGVTDGSVSPEQFDAAHQSGEDESDTMEELLIPIWAVGEAIAADALPDESQVASQLGAVQGDGFANEQQFIRFLARQGLCTTSELETGDPQNCTAAKLWIYGQIIVEDIAESQSREDFVARWRLRTVCAEGYLVDSCSNGPEPER